MSPTPVNSPNGLIKKCNSLPLPPNCQIFNTQAPHQLGVIQVTPIKNHRALQAGLDAVEIRAAEFLPLGEDGERVGALHGFAGRGGACRRKMDR